MIYGYEQPVQMPSMGVYDTDLIKSYIAGVREQYNQAQQDMKDFTKLYGDFVSQFGNDTDAYYNETLGAANQMMNQMYSNGIDPFKSPEARAMLTRFINSRDVGLLNKMKKSSENWDKYQEAIARARQDGTYDANFENWWLQTNNIDPTNWNTKTNGIWNRLSPDKYETLDAATYRMLGDLKDSFIKTENGYDWNGVDEQRVRDTIRDAVPGFLQTTLGQYYKYLAERDLRNEGNVLPTQEQIIQRLQDNMFGQAGQRQVRSTKEENPEHARQAKFANDVALERMGQAHDREMEMLRHNNKQKEAAFDAYLKYTYDRQIMHDQLNQPGSNPQSGISYLDSFIDASVSNMYGEQINSGTAKNGKGQNGVGVQTQMINYQHALLHTAQKHNMSHPDRYVLNNLTIPVNQEDVAQILGIEAYKKDGYYDVPNSFINKLYAPQHIFSRLEVGRQNRSYSQSKAKQTTSLRSRANTIPNSPIRIELMNGITSYLSTSGTMKGFAPVKITYYTQKPTAKDPGKTQTAYAYIDTGIRSNIVEDGKPVLWSPGTNNKLIFTNHQLNLKFGGNQDKADLLSNTVY